MTKPLSLGEQLAQTRQEEKDNTRRLAELRAQQESAEARANFQLVEKFFEDAKVFFTEGIQARRPVKELSILVGQMRVGLSDNLQVSRLLCYYTSNNQAAVLSERHPYHSLWKAFQTWAESNGLTPAWVYEHDGGGVCSWYQLKIAPTPQSIANARMHHLLDGARVPSPKA